jgi:AraC-like DNA-binding protein
MDVLSEILNAIHLEGALFFNAEFSAPWCLSSTAPEALAPYISLESGHVILYHLLTEGRAYARLMDGPNVELTAGDIVVFPHGDAHVLGNGPRSRPADTFKTFQKSLTQGIKLVQFGGGGELTRFVCGFMACDPRLSAVVLTGLPKVLTVNVAAEPSGQWIENSIRYSVSEADCSAEGKQVVLAKLSEVLFVETLRRYISTLPEEQKGWLAGARDPVISKVLALIHKDPGDPWTIANLARRVGLSRTRLAERFRHFLGESPISYLTQWRLKLGADILQSTDDSVAEVAAAVGYGSEAAFNRAFKREFNCPPAQFRRKHKVALSRSASD